ncbi:MAG: hypothetical protein IJR47_02230, partial [Clostridia bacterium]|nr:hypothetical protein [Clostridia bacterium]
MAIRNLVMRSVPNLASDKITIVDSNMKMYKDEDDSGVDISDEQLALQRQTKLDLENQILNLLTPVFGQNKVSTSVNVVLDFDKKVTTKVTFEPPVEGETDGLVVSMKELVERINGGTTAEGQVGVDPNGAVTTYPTIIEDQDGTYYKATREFNAEINETKEQIESARGQISELSISVIIDGDENVVTEEVLAQVSDLVSKGIGVEPNNVSVARMPFKALEDQAAEAQRQEELVFRQTLIRYGSLIAIAII